MKRISKLFLCFLTLHSVSIAENLNKVLGEKGNEVVAQDEKAKLRFWKLTLTRSWGLGIQQVGMSKNEPEVYEGLQKGLVAYAFDYWVMTQKGLIDDDLSINHHIKQAFLTKELNPKYLSDPLLRYDDHSGNFAISGTPLKDNEYKELAQKFALTFAPK